MMNSIKINNNQSNDENDWRFIGQDKFLKGVKLKFKKFNSTINNDHEHCIFCTSKISESPKDINEAYCTLDEKKWICQECYKDFNYMFKWSIEK
jgi:transposase-like protein